MFDSDEFEEYVETVNKLGANVRCIEEAEGAVPESYIESGAKSKWPTAPA
jgi:hypothetical protein